MKFNIRVYGILIFNNNVLVTKEKRFGKSFAKFPGGGLEFGEGTKDCLIREFMEEMNLKVNIGQLLYVNDFFQPSAFDQEQQIISFYYRVDPCVDNFNPNDLEVKSELDNLIWIPLEEIKEEDLTFPIDKVVVEQILKKLTC